VCQIFPASALKRTDFVRNALTALSQVYWDADLVHHLHGLLAGEDNILDSPRNFICLQPQLHRWWSKAYLALEPIEHLPKGVRIRVRWLPRPSFKSSDRVPLNTDPRDQLTCPVEPGLVKAVDLRTQRPIIDGNTYDIVSDDLSAVPSFEVLKLQWDLLKLAALSGAVDSFEELEEESENDVDFDLVPEGSRRTSQGMSDEYRKYSR